MILTLSIDYLINVEGSFLHFFWLLSLQNLDHKLISVIWCGEQSWKVPNNSYLSTKRIVVMHLNIFTPEINLILKTYLRYFFQVYWSLKKNYEHSFDFIISNLLGGWILYIRVKM